LTKREVKYHNVAVCSNALSANASTVFFSPAVPKHSWSAPEKAAKYRIFCNTKVPQATGETPVA